MKMTSTMLLLLFAGSVTAQKTTILTGEIKNTHELKVYIRREQQVFNADIDNGKFIMQVPVRDEAFFDFICGDNDADVYISPGDSVVLQSDEKDFFNSLKFSGDEVQENEYLNYKSYRRATLYSPMLSQIRKYKEDAFVPSLDSVMGLINKDWLNFQKEHPGLNKRFVQLENANNEYI